MVHLPIQLWNQDVHYHRNNTSMKGSPRILKSQENFLRPDMDIEPTAWRWGINQDHHRMSVNIVGPIQWSQRTITGRRWTSRDRIGGLRGSGCRVRRLRGWRTSEFQDFQVRGRRTLKTSTFEEPGVRRPRNW